MRTPFVAVAALCLAAVSARAQSPAASSCPPYFGIGPNIAGNSSFEVPAPSVPVGDLVCWSQGDPTVPPPTSAAKGWLMHTDNAEHTICTALRTPTDAPGPAGSRKLLVRAGANEGGVYQPVNVDPAKSYMFSVWVYVLAGHVGIQSRGTVGGPTSFSTRTGEWEQLRVCTKSLANTDMLVVFNQAPTGGSFYVDRAELREIPTLE